MFSMHSVAFLFSGKSKINFFNEHSLIPISCLPSQYLTLIHPPIKRVYIIASIMGFLIGMFIYRRIPIYRHSYYLGMILMVMIEL